MGLGEGLAVAMRQLMKHAYTSTAVNATALKQDKMFCLFLALSTAGFLRKAHDEFVTLAAQRKAAAKLATKKAEAAKAAGVVSAPSDAAAAADTGSKKKRAAKKKPPSEFWGELAYLVKIAIPSPASPGGQLLATQFTLLVMRTFVTVRMTKLSTYYLTKAISKASWRHWSNWAFHFGGWMTTGVMVNSGLRYVESLIAVELREALTRHAHKHYLKGQAFYKATVLKDGGIDNVDQRVAADIAEFSKEAAQLYGHSFKPILEFTMSLSEAAKELGYSRPLTLFASQVVIGGVLRGMAPKLGKMVAKEQQMEGEFRHRHSRLIAHAEEVAFLRGADAERALLNKSLADMVGTQRWHALQRIKKSVADNIGKFQGLLVGGVFVHIPFLMRPELGEGERISSFRATEELMLRCGSAFTEVLLLGKSLDELSGHVHRICELFRALEAGSDAAGAKPTAGDECIKLDHLSVAAPEPDGQKRLLVEDLSMEVIKGRNVLVTGPNGCGKTSLFRTIAGLWPAAGGDVSCPFDKLMWLPQKPYLVLGTLRDQVTYPKQMGFQKRFDERIVECLRMAGLTKLADNPEGLDLVREEWNDVLSGGERQRVGFARLYFHSPAFAVLDEATSAINPDEEERLYTQVVSQGTTILSIAHRMALRKHHQLELRVAGDGTGAYELVEL